MMEELYQIECKKKEQELYRNIIVVRGGGDLASGVVHKLHNCGYPIIILECEQPSAIRRRVCFSEAVYHGSAEVEKVICHRAESLEEAHAILKLGHVALMVDAEGKMIESIRPKAVIDAILAKKNLGTHIRMAPAVIALGPGFKAGVDVDFVIETKRGHHLGRLYEEGEALPNTGIPGVIQGYGKERVLHSPCAGIMKQTAYIGDIVEEGQIIAYVGKQAVTATLSGVLRGILPDGYPAPQGMKMADIDPRLDQVENCDTISDKARCIAGGVLEALLYIERLKVGNDNVF